MNMNDRIALELGRALLRALIAEDRAQELEAKLKQDEAKKEPDGDGDPS